EPATAPLHQALLDQGRERVQGRAADRLGRLERERAREDRQPHEQELLLLVQQLIAPVQYGPQCLLPGRSVARAARQQLEPMLQPVEDLRRAQHVRARRRQLDRERQAIEPTAELADRLVGHERRPKAPCTLDEQRRRRLLFERLKRILALAGDVEWLA